MPSPITDLRLALRSLAKAPAFTFTVVLLLGLGVGAVTTIFTVVDHVVLRPLPYPEADRVFVLERGSHSGVLFRELQGMGSVEVWGACWARDGNLVGEGDPLKIVDAFVSEGFLALFGARPALGRLLVREDFLAGDRAVLSHGAWQRIFGGDPGVVGRSIRVDGTPLMVVGVLDEGFLPPEVAGRRGAIPDLWRPMDWTSEALTQADTRVLEVMGRMAPGVTLADLNAELGGVSERLGRLFPEEHLNGEGRPYPFPAADLHEATTRGVRTGLGLLFGAVGLLLLVACMNVAHLFLARGMGRVQEMAVRRALGASTGLLLRPLLVESLFFGAAGGLLGTTLAALGLRSFLALIPTALPSRDGIALDGPIMVFAGLVAVGSVLLFGLAPAFRSAAGDLAGDLRGVSRGATTGRFLSRARGGLVVAEVALSLVLVASAGLLLKSFLRTQGRDPGFRAAGVWTIPLTPTGFVEPGAYVEALDRVEASLASVPGVTAATYSLTVPFAMVGRGRCCWMTSAVAVEGEARDGLRLLLQPVSESYFEALGIPLRAGQAWRGSDAGRDPWTVVLSENLAAQLFGSAEAAVGRELTIMGGEGASLQVVGVAADVRHFGLDQDPPLFVYLPTAKLPFTIPLADMAVHVRGDVPPEWNRTLREAVWAAAPELPVPAIRSMEEWIRLSTAGRRFDSALFSAFGSLALLLAAAGLYGTLLYNVGQRRREVGIRMALGAERRRVEGQVVGQGLALALAGCLLGLAGTWATGRLLQSRLHEVQATDPGTLAAAVALLLAAAAVASWLPARRASRVDPVEVLRGE